TVEHASADRARGLAQDADLDGPLVDWRAKGHVVEYLGTEDVDGTAAHKLRIALKDGDVEYLYLDPDAFLPIRSLLVAHVRGTEQEIVSDYGDYEKVGGVWIPFALDAGPKDGPRNLHLRLEKAEANVDADDALFRAPTGARKVVAGAGAVVPGASSPPPSA